MRSWNCVTAVSVLPPATNNKVFHIKLCVQLKVIVITVIYETSSWMLS